MLYVAPEWTPDGRYVLFVRPADPSWKRLEFWRVPVEGGKPEKIGLAMEQLNHPSFHPDGRNLAFTGMKPRQEVWAMQNFLPRVR